MIELGKKYTFRHMSNQDSADNNIIVTVLRESSTITGPAPAYLVALPQGNTGIAYATELYDDIEPSGNPDTVSNKDKLLIIDEMDATIDDMLTNIRDIAWALSEEVSAHEIFDKLSEFDDRLEELQELRKKLPY